MVPPEGCRLVQNPVIGFLPMLTQYGGRFFMHGTPFLAPSSLRILTAGFVERSPADERLASFCSLCCLCRVSATWNPAAPLQLNFSPALPPHVSLYYTLHRQTKDSAEIQALAEAIQENTTPDTLIHLPDEGMYHFGDMIVVLTSRATDTGGWGEVRKPEMIQAIRQHRENTHSGVFVSRHRENIPSSRCIEQIGALYQVSLQRVVL